MIGEMKPLSNIDDPVYNPAVYEVTHHVISYHINAQWTQPDSYSSTLCEVCSNSCPMPEMSVLMPSNVQIHGQVPLNNAKLSKETETT